MSAEFDGRFVTFRCECGQTMKVPVERAGAKGTCRSCGCRVTVPAPPERAESHEPPASTDYYSYALQQRDLEGSYSEEDLITYPDELPTRQPPAELEEEPEPEKSLFEMLGDILRYPVANKQATQIFATGAFIFGPMVWWLLIPGRFVPCLGFLINIIMLIGIISLRLMYFSYLLLIIEKSAIGSRHIPELPLFQSWQENLQDLVKVLAASAIAFAPYLVYSASINIQLFSDIVEAYSRGEPPGEGIMGGASSNLAMLMLMYATAAFYMPMVLMILVVTKKFGKAVNPVFVFRSIYRIRREYLSAMVIVFLFLRGSLTVFAMLKDVLASDWFTAAAGYVGEPIVKFYTIVVTTHVIGLLYYRNAKKLQW